jgi:hypothetical protein
MNAKTAMNAKAVITSPQNITSPRDSVAALLLLEENSHISDLEGQRLVSVTQLTYY